MNISSLSLKCVDLALKFVPERAVDVAALVCDRLANIGRYVQAGELFLSVEMVKEGLDMLMAGEAWDKARTIAQSIAPRYEQYVEDAYVEYLKQTNRPDEVHCVTIANISFSSTFVQHGLIICDSKDQRKILSREVA